jgi:hypothetical protein
VQWSFGRAHLANDSNREVVSVTERRFPPPWSVEDRGENLDPSQARRRGQTGIMGRELHWNHSCRMHRTLPLTIGVCAPLKPVPSPTK